MNTYFFDVDGVLSNLSQEVNKELIVKLSDHLLDGEPVGLISGRGLVWQLEHVVKPIENYIATHEKNNGHVIDNLFVSGEFGGVSILHKNGERITKINSEVSMPSDMRQKLMDVARDYDKIVFVEIEKQTMFSSAKRIPIDIELFRLRKPEMIAWLGEVVKQYPDFEIHSDRFSINIKHKKADKRYATGQVVTWLDDRGLHPDHYFAFGDSISDLDIGVELFARKLPMEFIFVGRKEELEGQKIEFPYTVTNADFDLGTLEYLNK
jgi:hydroxymethylpyrimidine pyrophosphatase-like HAD family hydrolase